MLNEFFSTKSRTRNQMNLEILNDHLMVKSNGPSIDLFDFGLNFEHWYSSLIKLR